MSYLKQEAGQHFDPVLIPLFLEHLPEIIEIKSAGQKKRIVANEKIGAGDGSRTKTFIFRTNLPDFCHRISHHNATSF